MKKPEYVATVTPVYRKALDEGNVTRQMWNDLLLAFNRQGFTDGYYTGDIGPQMFGIRGNEPENRKWLEQARQSYEAVENPLVPVKFYALITASGSQLAVEDPDGNICRTMGPVPEAARTVALTTDALLSRLGKTGGTPYRMVDGKAQIEGGLTLSAAAINAMRRDVLNELTALRARREQPTLGKPGRLRNAFGSRSAPVLTVQVTTREQITGRLLKAKPEVLYVPVHVLLADGAYFADLAQRQCLCAVLPRILHDGEIPTMKEQLRTLRAMGIRQVLVGNLGHLIPARECGMTLRGDVGLNVYNSRAMEAMQELELASAVLSFEMTLPQIRDISKPVPAEMLVYGRMSLMVTENCIMKNQNGQCICSRGPQKLVDKTGAEFPIIKDGNSCRSVLLNGKKLSMLDRKEELSRLGLWGLRLCFTTENPREVDRVLADVHDPAPFDPGACTRGLYLRGLNG